MRDSVLLRREEVCSASGKGSPMSSSSFLCFLMCTAPKLWSVLTTSASLACEQTNVNFCMRFALSILSLDSLFECIQNKVNCLLMALFGFCLELSYVLSGLC